MVRSRGISVVLAAVLLPAWGCEAPLNNKKMGASDGQAKSGKPFTAENNPTTLAGRGAPDLEDKDRPAAWIFVDGKAGKFMDRDGRPQLQWVIEEPVSATPKIHVVGYEPLLGDAKDFNCVLRTVESGDGSEVYYGIASKPGVFQPGKDFSLLNPGGDFVIRNGATQDLVERIAPLAPGTYAIAGGLRNKQTGKEALAVTYFTVAESSASR